MRGAAGRGGTYRIGGSDEAATGFTLYINRLTEVAAQTESAKMVYLPHGHDAEAASSLRQEGTRTVAQIGEGEDPVQLGCTHILVQSGLEAI